MREVTSCHHYLVDFHPFVEQLTVQCLWTYCVVFYIFRALDLYLDGIVSGMFPK